MSATSIALNRFGLGTRPDQPLPEEPHRWLIAQFDRFDPRPAPIAALPGRAQIAQELADYLERNKAFTQAANGGTPARVTMAASTVAITPVIPKGPTGGLDLLMAATSAPPPPPPKPPAPAPGETPEQTAKQELRRFIGQESRNNYVAAVGARGQVAVGTDTPFVERMVHFWANHFAVSADKLTTIGMAGLLEFEAIRPHVLATFGQMVNAVERHPAMLLYLDQAQSIGPNSMVGERAANRPNGRRPGLNENLAREIMELHTLGVRTGYTQADVTEFARAMTGWSISGLARGPYAKLLGINDNPGEFTFVDATHEPGTRTIMGKRYGQSGERQAQAVIDDLVAHPATATHIATKLARHFAGDTPPPALVDRLRTCYLQTGGHLPAMYRVLVDAPELWVEVPTKFRSPWEWSVASFRALQVKDVPAQQFTGMVQQLGQPVWRPGSPAGYEDLNATWAGADAVMRRVEAAERMAAKAGATVDARALANRLYPGGLSAATKQAIAQADSPQQALALLLVSPEAMRR
ncbi:DUF1800 domain-containing protein [Sphingomonas sp. GlSt437]|uniref:DUF1800 domain-containing protein n=1 Tax=Sphingomonas sp. GlSt437 TaxID=3389970 RepID=UPI003A8B5BC7